MASSHFTTMAWFKILLSAPNEPKSSLKGWLGSRLVQLAILTPPWSGQMRKMYTGGLLISIHIYETTETEKCVALSQFGVDYFVCAQYWYWTLHYVVFPKCSDWTTTLDESRSQNFKYSLCGTKHCFALGKLLNIWMHCLFALCVGAWNLINIFKSNLWTRVFAGTPSKASSYMLKNSE